MSIKGLPCIPHPFILDTDFSAIAVGGVLSQVQGGSEHFIGCFSKSCHSAQINYPSVEINKADGGDARDWDLSTLRFPKHWFPKHIVANI